MMDIGKRMMRDAIKDGFTLTVYYDSYDDGYYAYKGTDLETSWIHATAVDDPEILLTKKEGLWTYEQWAFLVHGNDPSETINDYSVPADGSDNWLQTWCSNNG